ncbi:MAG TPA: branched-chain amino acid ABC transporter substrate-binding protein [Acidimicrobiales bacterium]|nr:branched-chain amino acid ABC transporter substrate-binding protein [Acidimicrobiales bacterium]
MARSHAKAMQAAAVLGVAVLGLGACGSSKSSTSSGTSGSSGSSGGSASAVKIGFFGALSGDNQALGQHILDGEKLAVQQYMAASPKVAVTIDPFDSQGDPAQANNGAQKLIGDHIVALLGPAFSGESKAANPQFAAAQIPHVTASATNVALAQSGDNYFFRALADDGQQGPADADYLAKTVGAKTVAVIDDNSSYGLGLADAVRAELKTDGATDAVDDHVDPKGQDYSSTVNKIVAAHPAAVFYGGYYDAAGRLINQLKSKGFTGTFMSGDGSEDPNFITDAGGAPAEGALLSSPGADVTTQPNGAAFTAAYTKAFGQGPEIYSAEAYDATNFILAAIKAGNTTGPAINTYLHNNTYQGITKTLKFQANGNVTSASIYIYKVENGKIVEIGTANGGGSNS